MEAIRSSEKKEIEISPRPFVFSGYVMALTAKQRALQREMDEIASLTRIDYWNIETYQQADRTSFLLAIRNQMIRGEIIMRYTLLDEYLTDIICNYYFRKPKRGQSYRQLWRTKKFQIFNHQMMDETFLIPKMRIVHAISPIPKDVRVIIERINSVRNDIAHSLFPENRKGHRIQKARLYQGADIFTKAGLEKFLEDYFKAADYLQERAFGALRN